MEKVKKRSGNKQGSRVKNKRPVNYASWSDERLSIVEEASAGISVTHITDLISVTDMKKEYFASLLDLSTKTLDRYHVQKKKLNPSNSELLLKMEYIYKKGSEVFGSLEAFRAWIEKPAPGLNNKKPLELMKTATGIDLLQEELVRIEFGYPV